MSDWKLLRAIITGWILLIGTPVVFGLWQNSWFAGLFMLGFLLLLKRYSEYVASYIGATIAKKG
jgi:hypothetical protein